VGEEFPQKTRVITFLGASLLGRSYLELLTGMVGVARKPRHPKEKAVVDGVIEACYAFEKTLIFIARWPRDILHERIASELSTRAQRCLTGKRFMRALRGRLTRSDGDVNVLGLERVRWSQLQVA